MGRGALFFLSLWRFLQAYQEKNQIVKVGGKKAVLKIGNEAWPFPVPIKKVGRGWRFSTKQGKGRVFELPDRQK